MRLSVRSVIELVRPNGIGERLGEIACLVVVVGWILVGYGWNGVDLGTKHAQEVDLLLTLQIWEFFCQLDNSVIQFSRD